MFKIADLTNWAVVVLIRIFLCEALHLWFSTYLWNVWFLSATSLFIWSASCCMSSFYKLWHLILLLIKIFQHLWSRHLWSLSRFSKNLWSTFDHLLNWILSLFLILRRVVLLIRIWLRNIVSELGTVMMSMKVRLRIASFFLNWVMNFTNQLIALMCSKAFVLDHASLVAVVVTHDSRWVYNNSFGLLLSGSRSKSIFHGLHLRILIEVETFGWFVSFILLLDKLMWVSRISLIWSSSVIVTECTNAFLRSLVSTCCSSKKTIWHIFGSNHVVWNKLMPERRWSIFFLNNLRLLNLSWSSCLLFIDVDFKIDGSLILEAVLSFDHLSSILDAKNTSVVLTVVTVLLLLGVLGSQSLLSVEVGLSFRFSTYVTLLLSNWIWSCLSSWSYRAHSFTGVLNSLKSSIISLLSKFLLIKVVI